MDHNVGKKLNKQALLFVFIHSIFFLNLAFDFIEIPIH